MSMHVNVSVPTLRPLIEECEEDVEEAAVEEAAVEEEEAVVLDSDEDEQDS